MPLVKDKTFHSRIAFKNLFPIVGTFRILIYIMRIISRKTFTTYWKKHSDAEQPLKSWIDEAINANWNSANELKQQYRNASIITKKRVVFNIKGNHHRMVVDIEYKLGIIFIVWIGTHKEYDKLRIKEINYV